MERLPNAKQKQVIENVTDNMIVFASAGTGKTYTLAMRVANIVEKKLAKTEEILCLTFTIKACGEMREDLQAYLGATSKSVTVKTIHGFCYQIMREEDKRQGNKRSEATVCDEVDEERLLRSILSSRYTEWEYATPSEQEYTFGIYQKRTALRELVSELKHARLACGAYTDDSEQDYRVALKYLRENHAEKYANIFSYYAKYEGRVCDEHFQEAIEHHAGKLVSEYDRYLAQSNQADYDDLIIETARYLSDPEIRARHARRYKYIMVDEMQDTSRTEYAILRQLFDGNNCMLCGDIFQTLYGWRGSAPEEILRAFAEEFHAKAYTLTESYRSTVTLTRAGAGYLRNTYPAFSEYFPEEIVVKSQEQGDKIRCYAFDNEEQEAWQIYKYLQKHRDADVCVVARTNKYIASLYRYFEKYNANEPEKDRLDFFTVEENCQFYKKSVIKDVLAVLRLALNPSDDVSMERLAEKYVKGVGLQTLERLRNAHALGIHASMLANERYFPYADPYEPLITALDRGEVVVYDTETTGLDLARDEAVQISAVKIDKGGRIIDSLNLFVKPAVPITQGAYETHGLDEKYLLCHGAVSANEALTRFSAFVDGAVVVGHNSANFDAPLLKRQYREQGLPLPSIVEEYDTLHIAKLFLPRLKNHKLSTLCERFSIVNERAHDAFSDITATAGVLCNLVKSYLLPTANARREFVAEYGEKFRKFGAFIACVRSMIERNALFEAVKYILERMRLKQVYTGVGDLRALQDVCAYFSRVHTSDAENFLRNYLLDASLSGNQLDILSKDMRRIPIVTVHQVKGCEFDTVIIAGADDQHFPSFMAQDQNATEEEKRVFYVAITRAKRTLILTRFAYRGRAQIAPTRYFYKIPSEYVESNALWEGVDE